MFGINSTLPYKNSFLGLDRPLFFSPRGEVRDKEQYMPPHLFNKNNNWLNYKNQYKEQGG